MHPVWRHAWQQKEEALRQRFHHSAETRDDHSRFLPAFNIGDRCYIQNQTGNHPRHWEWSGTVVELHGHDSYTLKVDGTGRVTRRNRRYLRPFQPASLNITSRSLFTKSIAATPRHSTLQPNSTAKSAPMPIGPPPSLLLEPLLPLQPLPSSLPMPVTLPTPTEMPAAEPSQMQVADPSQMQLETELPVATPFIADPTNVRSTDTGTSTRPCRTKRLPPKYVPETGQWI